MIEPRPVSKWEFVPTRCEWCRQQPCECRRRVWDCACGEPFVATAGDVVAYRQHIHGKAHSAWRERR